MLSLGVLGLGKCVKQVSRIQNLLDETCLLSQTNTPHRSWSVVETNIWDSGTTDGLLVCLIFGVGDESHDQSALRNKVLINLYVLFHLEAKELMSD